MISIRSAGRLRALAINGSGKQENTLAGHFIVQFRPACGLFNRSFSSPRSSDHNPSDCQPAVRQPAAYTPSAHNSSAQATPRAIGIVLDAHGLVKLFQQTFWKRIQRTYPDLFVKDFRAFGLDLQFAFDEGERGSVFRLAGMIQDHHYPPIDHMYAGVSMTIEVEGIPIARRVLGIAPLPAIPAYRAGRTESQSMARGIVEVYAIGSFCNGNILHPTRYTPVIPHIPFFHLELL